jgi:hypothetical protein
MVGEQRRASFSLFQALPVWQGFHIGHAQSPALCGLTVHVSAKSIKLHGLPVRYHVWNFAMSGFPEFSQDLYSRHTK